MQSQYRDSRALWRAVTDRAKTQARVDNSEAGVLIRAFVVDRFLARVFSPPGDQWVLKGGNAVLARVQDARATKDVDLLAELEDLDAAVKQLQTATAIDLGDFLRFVIRNVKELRGDQQPAVSGYRVSVDAYCGAIHRQSFGIDVVTGSLMTAEADVLTRPSLLPSIPSPEVRLYPTVDHIADKVAATQSLYGAGADKPSSRVRDLVDLVIFANTQVLDGGRLQTALTAEWTHRGLPGRPHFEPPTHWERLYPPIAAKVTPCNGVIRYSDAVDLVGRLLAPALSGTATGLTWMPKTGSWAVSPLLLDAEAVYPREQGP